MNRMASRRLLSSTSKARNVVLVDGCRIPFTLAGTTYNKYMAVDLARFALKGIVAKTAIDPKLVRFLFESDNCARYLYFFLG
jgi:hypothetical protein